MVEDHEINREVTEGILRKAGIHPEHATNGHLALTMVRESPQPYDAVLMDLQMPVMDGYETTRRLRKHHDARTLPIIAMTAHALTSEKERCLALGMNHYLTKPVDVQALYRCLLDWIGKPDPVSADTTTTVDDGSPTEGRILTLPATVPGIDLTQALERLVGDRALLIKLATLFQRNHAHKVDTIKTLLDHGEFKAAARLIHGLKGVAGNMGAIALHRAATELEHRLKKGDRPDWKPLWSPFQQRFDTLLEGCALLTTIDTGTIPRPPNDRAEPLVTGVDTVIDLLRQGDFQARERFQALKKGLNEANIDSDRLQGVQQLLEELDFEGAINGMEAIRQQLPADENGVYG